MDIENVKQRLPMLFISLAIFISLIVSSDFDILRNVMISQRTYTNYNISSLKSLNLYRPYEVDYRTCSQYVKQIAQEHDIIIGFGQPITRYVYTGRLDYAVKANSGKTIDMHTNTMNLSSLDAMFQVIENSAGRRVWILGDDCAFVPNWYTAEMCDYLRSLAPYAVCRGEEGKANAYLLNRTP
jgi:hypothetical protein